MVSDINKLGLDVKWQNLTPGCTIVGSCTAEVFRTGERLSPGHRMCAGCGATIAVRNVLRGLHEEDEAVITCATGCLEVSSFMYPYTAWKDSFIHNAFENAGATCSGVEAAYRALKKKGKVEKEQVSDHAVQEMKKRIGEMETRQKKQSKKKRMGINIAVIAGVAICGVALQQKGVQKQFSKTIETFKEENENASMEMHTPTVTEEAVIEEQSNTTEAEEHIDQPEASEDEKNSVSDTTETMENIHNGAQYYTIQPGDTLVSICMKEFSSLEKMDEIMRLNQIQDKNKIVAGQRLKLYE